MLLVGTLKHVATSKCAEFGQEIRQDLFLAFFHTLTNPAFATLTRMLLAGLRCCSSPELLAASLEPELTTMQRQPSETQLSVLECLIDIEGAKPIFERHLPSLLVFFTRLLMWACPQAAQMPLCSQTPEWLGGMPRGAGAQSTGPILHALLLVLLRFRSVVAVLSPEQGPTLAALLAALATVLASPHSHKDHATQAAMALCLLSLASLPTAPHGSSCPEDVERAVSSLLWTSTSLPPASASSGPVAPLCTLHVASRSVAWASARETPPNPLAKLALVPILVSPLSHQ
jgi:hypothetical protein